MFLSVLSASVVNFLLMSPNVNISINRYHITDIIFVKHRKFNLISKQTIARILEDAHIEEVIGEFVKLKKSGQNYKGLSPFTTERNPSFYVSPARASLNVLAQEKAGMSLIS